MAAEPTRRFITRTEVEDAARSGQSIRLGDRDVITDEAAQRARDLNVAVDRAGGTPPRPATGSAPTPAADTAPAAAGALRAAVRSAVVAELGREPAGLDAALDKVLARRSG